LIVMPLLQKITRPTVLILGTAYPPRIVGLHNRVRAHARRLLVYKDLALLPLPATAGTRGLFVPGRRRLVIYLKRGSPESTLAHELVHALLYGEGFLPLRCRKDDLLRHPEIGTLAGKINDLIVHPVVFARLRRSGYQVELEGAATGAGPRRMSRPQRQPSPSKARASGSLELLSHAVGAAEALHRLPKSEIPDLRRRTNAHAPGLWSLARSIARAAPWDPERTALEARVLTSTIVRLLESAGERLLPAKPSLTVRLLMPPYMTARRLEARAFSLFDPGLALADEATVVLTFLGDGAACSARTFTGPDQAARAMDSIRREMRGMSVAQFIDRHRIEYLLIEGGGRCSARTGGRPHEAEALFQRMAAKRR